MNVCRVTSTFARIAAALYLFGASGHHPYVYYQGLRWVVCAVAVYAAVVYKETRFPWLGWVFGLVAILFNPLVPFHLNRQEWYPIDTAVAVLMIGSCLMGMKPKVVAV